MGLYILVFSLLLQLATIVVTGMIAWATIRRSWILITSAIALMAVRRTISLYQAVVESRSIDPLAESVALLISSLMFAGFLTVFLRERPVSPLAREMDSMATARDASHPGTTAVFLGILIVVASSVVAYLSFSLSRSALLQKVFSTNASLAQSLSTLADSHRIALSPSERVGLIEDVWNTLPVRYRGSYVCVVDSEGDALLHTKNPSIVGEYVGDRMIDDEAHRYSNLDDLLESGSAWVGWYTSGSGESQIASFAYSSALSSVIGVHVPKQAVEREILLGTLPLGVGLVVIMVIFVPAALGLLYRAYSVTLSEVRSSEARYRAVVEDQTELICRNLSDATLTFVNDAYCRYFGRKREELVGQRFTPMIPEEDRARVQASFASLGQGTPVITHEHRVITHDGEIRWQKWTNRAILDEAGKVIEYQGTGRDITERKRSEEERRILETQLRQSQKMEAIGQLAGGVAHDFNNILTAIFGHVELCIHRVRGAQEADPRVVHSMEQIEKAARRASALTQKLLIFSRRDVVQPNVLDLNHVLSELDEMLRPLIAEDIALDTVTAPELRSVRADLGQLEQVIVNLVVNAADAMPDGGKLTLETRNVTLDEDYTVGHAEAQAGEYVMLAVSDTGHGMDAATRERIFEPFFTTKPVDKGTGLGLATVHGIVKQAGGHIMVYSEPGRGTTFKVYLPAINAVPDDQKPTTQPSVSPRGRETVLLCEDDQSVRELIAESLRTAGYTVITAASGQEGLDTAQAYDGAIDLLITDVIMPDLNGRALAERLRSTFPGLPTLFISGYTSNVIAHHGVLDEGVEFLGKPFTRQVLLAKVRTVLGKARPDD